MKILLVDDDVGILQVLLPALKSMRGTQARAAISGAEAMESVAEWGGIDLLITDVFMSPMNGFTLRNKLRQSYPALRSLFLSGYDMSSYAEHIEDSKVLCKPFNINQLMRAIAAMHIESASTTHLIPTGTHSIAVNLHEISKTDNPNARLLKEKDVTTSITLGVPEFPHVLHGSLVGRTLGNYQVLSEFGPSHWGTLYRALQLPMNRAVVMDVLSSDRTHHPNVKQKFLADAAAKANKRHPFLLDVYEAGDVNGYCFYTYELIEGHPLSALIAVGKNIDDPVAEAILNGVAEIQAYFQSHKIPRVEIEAAHIFLGPDQKPRMVNPVIEKGKMPDERMQIKALAEILCQALPGGRASGKSLRMMLVCMRGEGELALTSWEALIQFSRALRPKTTPLKREEPACKIRATFGKHFVFWSLISLGLIFVFFKLGDVGKDEIKVLHSKMRNFNRMIPIPAGEFIYQDGRKLTLPGFWIDQYEVTLRQYSKFLEYLQQNPSEATKFDHPQQPKGKSHLPHDWEKIYDAAQTGSLYKNLGIDLSCPVFNIDWWDASAYAQWKGHRLPTEQEWEKAARGCNGNIYPWGNEWNPKKCNSNAGHLDQPGKEVSKSKGDGFVGCCPVDAIPADISPFGVVGMAGNVSEWTGSRETLGKCPVIRGGNFATTENQVTHRIVLLAPDGVSEYVGFRTVSDTPPLQ